MSDQQYQHDAPRPQYPSQTPHSHFPPHPAVHHQSQNKNNGREAQEEASIKKAAGETKYFWNLVAKANLMKQQNTYDGTITNKPNQKNDKNKMREEMLLFWNNSESSQEVPQGVFKDSIVGVIPDPKDGDSEETDPIIVDRSGAGEENVPILENFSELKIGEMFKVPSFVIDNIALMKYEVPTPIQQHSIPLGIAGFDLMCCAQTGSGKTFSFLLPVIAALFFSNSSAKCTSEKSNLSEFSSVESCNGSESPSLTSGYIASNGGNGGNGGGGGLASSLRVLGDLGGEVSSVTDGESPTPLGILSPLTPNTPHGGQTPFTPNGGQTLQGVQNPRAPHGSQGPQALQCLDERGCLPRGIIMAPTRELVCQINIEAKKLCYNSNIKSVVVYGGTDVRSQLLELSSGCDLIVATPGRLFDYVERGVVSFCKVEFLILDEADRMLDMGFEPQIRKIIQGKDMPPKEARQTFLFSATFPDEIKNLARQFLRNNYIFISVGRVGSTVKNIHQRLIRCPPDQNMKMELLIETIKEVEGRTLIFVQKKKTASWVNSYLRSIGLKCEEIHGNCTQLQRENSLRNFKNGNNLILIATDVAARGLDVPSVTHVIQYDMPISSEDFDTYVHRIGRTGRAGKNGVATSFYMPGRGGEGNGGIAGQLMTLMKENGQTIPEWFSCLSETRYSNNGPRQMRPQQNRPQYGAQGGQFGNRDSFNSARYASQGYVGNGGGMNGGNGGGGKGGNGVGGTGESGGSGGYGNRGYVPDRRDSGSSYSSEGSYGNGNNGGAVGSYMQGHGTGYTGGNMSNVGYQQQQHTQHAQQIQHTQHPQLSQHTKHTQHTPQAQQQQVHQQVQGQGQGQGRPQYQQQQQPYLRQQLPANGQIPVYIPSNGIQSYQPSNATAPTAYYMPYAYQMAQGQGEMAMYGPQMGRYGGGQGGPGGQGGQRGQGEQGGRGDV